MFWYPFGTVCCLLLWDRNWISIKYKMFNWYYLIGFGRFSRCVERSLKLETHMWLQKCVTSQKCTLLDCLEFVGKVLFFWNGSALFEIENFWSDFVWGAGYLLKRTRSIFSSIILNARKNKCFFCTEFLFSQQDHLEASPSALRCLRKSLRFCLILLTVQNWEEYLIFCLVF